MVLPPPPCFHCTLKNGFYISNEDGNVHQLVDKEDASIDATCPEKFQCVGHPDITPITNMGCCYPCSLEQSCRESTISQHHPFTDNICPDGHICDPSPKRCLAGEICTMNKKLDCVVVQEEAKENGFGMIFDGTYCEEGSASITNCPTGYYCPNAKEKVLCPSGFFCPMKVRTKTCRELDFILFSKNISSCTKTKTPEIKCVRCIEGSTERLRDNSYPIILLVSIIILCFIRIIIFEITKQKQEKSQLIPSCTGDLTIEDSSAITENLSSQNDSEIHSFCIEMRYENLSLVLRKQLSYVNMRSKNTANSERKCILNNASGVIRPKRLCALLGESGAGKSTLLNILSGRGGCSGDISGNIIVNGKAFKGNFWNRSSTGNSNLKSLIGYVHQDDVLYTELTVWENLFWAGRFQLSCTNKEVDKLTDHVINCLDLGHVRNMQIGKVSGGISGGERRRVSIGISLMTKPKVLLCDEPTSGLDSSSSMTVMSILRNLAHENNMTVFCSIHQPRQKIFSLFDDLVLLSKGGNVIYSGETKDAMTYFHTQGYHTDTDMNPADFLLDLSTGRGYHSSEKISMRKHLSINWSQHCKQHNLSCSSSTVFSNENVDISSRLSQRPLPATQFLLQCKRNFLLLRRNVREKLFDSFIIIICSIIMSWVEGIDPLIDENVERPISFDDIVSRTLPLHEMYQFSVNPVPYKQQ
jgi:ABC-type multidrug transport system ATPase subunit